LSFAEWRALAAPPRSDALDRAGLQTLMNAFPD
jgi:hypothetical protein